MPAIPPLKKWTHPTSLGCDGVMKAIHVLRKPCSESTVAANVLAHGTGALNIDGCRIGSESTRRVSNAGTNGDGWGMGTAFHVNGNPLGRWPANVLFTHAPGCVRVGSQKVKATSGIRPDDVGTDYGKQHKSGSMAGAKGVTLGATYADADGTETVAAYDCAPGCPVAALDAQSGILLGRGNRTSLGSGSGSGVTGWGKGRTDAPPRPELNDAGGASRFFKQFVGESA